MACTSTVTAAPMFTFGASETLNGDAVSNQIISHTAHEVRPGNLNSSSTIPVSIVSEQNYALVGGTKTIDLAALATHVSAASDCTGKKLQGIRFTNVASNAAMTLTGEGSNGYSLGGAITIPAATSAGAVVVTIWAPEALADVAAADRYLVVTGTGTQTFYLDLLIG